MSLKIALCQMNVVENKEKNLLKAEQMIEEAASKGAEIVVLPEMFNCPYSNNFFKSYAEPKGGETELRLAESAKKNNIYLAGGSIPEQDEDKIYNTSFFFDRNGNVIGRHRKMHLFDIHLEGKIHFMESDILSPGNEMTVVNTEYGKIGLAICYDMRFPELFRMMVLEGAEIIIVPAAFSMITGAAHWDITTRTRALDNQAYVIAVSPARDVTVPFQAYGHSCVTNPWGQMVAQMDEKEGVLVAEIDYTLLNQVRAELPLLQHRRKDIYTINQK